MTVVNTLQSQGITLSMVQLAILGVIVVYIIGMYWKILVTGAAVIGVAMVMLHSENTTPIPTANASKTPAIITPEPTINHNKPPTDFMEDCIKGAEYSKDQCEKIWIGEPEET
jgi:hypothetical protein